MEKARRALISVTDKTDLVDFAKGLADLGIELISTGGTAKMLREAGLDVVEVSDYTGFPELLDGRVKTLHPKVHGGILFRRENPEHVRQCEEHGIKPIDLVIVNLYNFAKSAADPSNDLTAIVEEIDIGGPAMIRAAAKNLRYVTVVVDPEDYPTILAELKERGNTKLVTRFAMARKVFSHIVAYDATISRWFTGINSGKHPFFKEHEND